MKVVFESDDPHGESLREMAIGRVTFAMRRLSWLVPRARVQMSDVNGPRGGVDKRCQIELKTDTSGTVVVTAMARDWRTALDSALARASHVLMRRSQRRQSFPRQRATLRLAQGGCVVKCPVCADATLVMSERQGVEIDYCPQCRGVWLDRGELDKLLERAQQQPVAAQPPGPVPRRPDFVDSDHHQGHRHYPTRRKSWLSEIFD